MNTMGLRRACIRLSCVYARNKTRSSHKSVYFTGTVPFRVCFKRAHYYSIINILDFCHSFPRALLMETEKRGRLEIRTSSCASLWSLSLRAPTPRRDDTAAGGGRRQRVGARREPSGRSAVRGDVTAPRSPQTSASCSRCFAVVTG